MSAIVESVNREIAVFETYFRRFFRGEDRSNLQSPLFNVPGRLVAGCWADYENMGAVFEQLLATIPAEQIGRNCAWKLYDSDADIFGDGSLRFFKLPGHSAGEGSLLVRLASRNLMLTADTVHVREALGREKPTLFDSDPVAAVRSVQRLRQLIAENGADSWIAHDAEDWQRYCTFPNPLT